MNSTQKTPGGKPGADAAIQVSNVRDFASYRARRQTLEQPSPQDIDCTTHVKMLRQLEQRFLKFRVHLFPLTGEQYLLSSADGFTRTVPDIRAAAVLLRQWEAA